MLFAYVGAKSSHFHWFAPHFRRKCEHILPHLTDCLDLTEAMEYREPFAGSLSFLPHLVPQAFFEKVKRVWVNDLDPKIAAIWHAVTHYPAALEDRMRAFLFVTAAECKKFRTELGLLRGMPVRKAAVVDAAAKALVLRRLSWSGIPRGGIAPGKVENWSLYDANRSIRAWHQQLSRYEVRVTCRDFVEVITTATEKSLLYVDPPYYGCPGLYDRDFTWRDHVRLADALSKTRAKWVMSHLDHRAIRDLYSWAIVREVPFSYDSRRRRRQVTELVLLG